MNNMSRTTKILLGIAMLWPIFFVGLFILFFLGMAVAGPHLGSSHGELPPLVPILFGTMVVFYVLTFMGAFALQVIFLVHLFTTDRVQKDTKALWAVLLFLGGPLAMPVYWYFNIWREPAQPAEVHPASEGVALRPDKWSRGGRIALGIATIWPLVWGGMFNFVFFRIFDLLGVPGAFSHPEAVISAIAFFILHIFTVLLVMAFLVLYIVHIGMSGRVPRNRMALWIVLVLLGHMLTMPVYWYLYIWREPQPEGGLTQHVRLRSNGGGVLPLHGCLRVQTADRRLT